MRNVTVLALFFAGIFSANAQTWFHNSAHISEVKLVFEQQNWDHILDSFYVDGDEERLLAAVWVDGVYFDSIGVRYKGFSSVSVDIYINPFFIYLFYFLFHCHFFLFYFILCYVFHFPSFFI